MPLLKRVKPILLAVTACLVIFSPMLNVKAMTFQAEEKANQELLQILGSELSRLDRPAEYVLAIPAMQDFLHLSESERTSISSAYSKAEDELEEGYQDYLNSLKGLHSKFRDQVLAILDASQAAAFQQLLLEGSHSGLTNESSLNPDGANSERQNVFHRLWKTEKQFTSSTLKTLLGTEPILRFAAQWQVAHVLAIDATRQAEIQLRQSLGRKLLPTDARLLETLELSTSQKAEIHEILGRQAAVIPLRRNLEIDQQFNRDLNHIIYQAELTNAEQGTLLEFRNWLAKNLTPTQKNRLLAEFLRSFAEAFPSANPWCLVDMAVELDNDQVDEFQRIRKDFFEDESRNWQTYVERCRESILDAHKSATDRLKNASFIELKRVTEQLTQERGQSLLPRIKAK